LQPKRARTWPGWITPGHNWNPWTCSNWLNAALLLEKDDARRADMVHKTLKVLDEFLDPYPAAGGCDEGPSCWGAAASLYHNLSWLNLATQDAFRYALADKGPEHGPVRLPGADRRKLLPQLSSTSPTQTRRRRW
jgi:hypothetical protein